MQHTVQFKRNFSLRELHTALSYLVDTQKHLGHSCIFVALLGRPTYNDLFDPDIVLRTGCRREHCSKYNCRYFEFNERSFTSVVKGRLIGQNFVRVLLL